MAKSEPVAICYKDVPDQVIGWVCGDPFCRTVYLASVVGEDAETMALHCCDHPCWKCGRKAIQGFVLCALCRTDVHVRAHRLRPDASMVGSARQTMDKLRTLTAPEGSIGAIGTIGSSESDPDVQDPDSGDSP
jgi:hypothetical protein